MFMNFDKCRRVWVCLPIRHEWARSVTHGELNILMLAGYSWPGWVVMLNSPEEQTYFPNVV